MSVNKRQKSAFLLLELLVSISIIALLLLAAGYGITASRMRGRDATRMTDALSIGKAADSYISINRGVRPLLSSTTNTVGCADQISGLSLSEFSRASIPKDPQPEDKQVNPSCTSDSSQGYQYSVHGRNGTSSYDAGNIAIYTQRTYAILIGLEYTKNSDDTSFIKPEDLKCHKYSFLANDTYLTPEANNTVNCTDEPAIITPQTPSGKRNQFLFLGQYCGSDCSL